MPKFKVGDQVTVLPEIRESHPGRYDGQWEVQEMRAYNDATSVVVCRDGTRTSLYEDCFERVQPSRMIFPFEELPEDERGEFAYQEVWPNLPVFYREPWMQSVYDGTFAQFHKAKAESKLVGCPVVMETEDGRRSTGTITGVDDVKYDHGELLSYVLTLQGFPRCAPPVARKRVVHRASRGLRAPKPYVHPWAEIVGRVLGRESAGQMEKMW